MTRQRTNPLTATRPAMPPATESRHIVERFDRSLIRRDGGTQMRLGINKMKAMEYAELKKHGHRFDPIRLFYDGTDYWLGDGFHREAADDINGETHTRAEIHPGTRRDAILYAASEANNKHGLPPSLADRQNAARVLLEDEEWSKWGDREIGRRVGLSHPTIGRMRAKIDEEKGRENQAVRIGADGRETDTTNIGSNQTARATAKPSPPAHTASNGAVFEQTTQSPNQPITQEKSERWTEQNRLHTLEEVLCLVYIQLNKANQQLTAENYGFGIEYQRLTEETRTLRDEIRKLTPGDRL